MELCTTDAQGRVSLPASFANATVVVNQVSDSEVRSPPQGGGHPGRRTPPFREEAVATLSDRDRDRFLDLLDNPPEPTPSLLLAARRHAERHG